jgi:hypothetical protein
MVSATERMRMIRGPLRGFSCKNNVSFPSLVFFIEAGSIPRKF